jgi:GTP-binding protein
VIKFTNTHFIKTVVDVQDRPPLVLPEIIFIGRSNVGKSSLINAITEHNGLAKTSSKPGKTRYLNYFNVNDECYLVDAPGFGFTEKGRTDLSSFATLMENYFAVAKPSLGLYLIDSRREISQEDVDFIHTINKTIQVHLVFTKTDKLNQSETSKLHKLIKVLDIKEDTYTLFTVKQKKSITRLQQKISQLIFPS